LPALLKYERAAFMARQPPAAARAAPHQRVCFPFYMAATRNVPFLLRMYARHQQIYSAEDPNEKAPPQYCCRPQARASLMLPARRAATSRFA